MKVLMTADAVGGVWTYALELAAALAPHGAEVLLVTMGPAPGPDRRAEAEALPNVDLVSLDGRLEWMADPWADVARAGERLLELADRARADVVHLNGYAHATLPWRRSVLVVAHSCVTTWWGAVHGCAPPAEWSGYRARVAAGLAAADAVVAPTHAFLRRLVAAYGPVPRASVVHNARAPTGLAGDPWAAREPLVFGCGRLWDEAKEMRVLDAAARGLPWRTCIAGDAAGPDGGRFVATGAECLGPLAGREIAAWLRRAAIFAHPSRYEPFGLAPLEAALAGCALVLTDLPELRELWDGAAVFVPPGDADALHGALRGLVADAPRRLALAAGAQQRATRYAPAAMGAAYAALYVALAGRAASRAVA